MFRVSVRVRIKICSESKELGQDQDEGKWFRAMPTARPPPKYERGSLVKLEWKSREGGASQNQRFCANPNPKKIQQSRSWIVIEKLINGRARSRTQATWARSIPQSNPPSSAKFESQSRPRAIPQALFLRKPSSLLSAQSTRHEALFSFARKTKGRARSAFFFIKKAKRLSWNGRAAPIFF